jgi:uracil-DNA glycosylase
MADAALKENYPASEPLGWKEVLEGEKDKPYFKDLMRFIESERSAGKTIYPGRSEIFSALSLTPFDSVRVVIIGQDPYPGPNQAHGLCFSVKPGIPIPGSLRNIFKELERSLGIKTPRHGSLARWAEQGVLLLNTVLTVEAGKPQSHGNLGWETFTDRVVLELNQRKSNLIFLLWGSHAQRKCSGIDASRHHILKAVHPSPLSAHRGFIGCGHFATANQILRARGEKEIDWSLE